MRNPFGRNESPAESDLIGIIRQVRRRWRMKLALRGAATVAALMVAVFLAAAFGLESSRFAPGAILTFRVVLPIALLVLIGLFFVRPLMRRVTDEQVALYLEEHEPSLQAEIISAVEASRQPGAAVRAGEAAGRLGHREVPRARGGAARRAPSAQDAMRASSRWSVSRRSRCSRSGPAYLRHALSALLLVSRSVEAAVPYRIEVTPGNVSVPQGRRSGHHRAAARVLVGAAGR